MKSKVLLPLVLLVFLASCATLDSALIEDESQRTELEDLRLEMDAEVFHLRADLIRQTVEEKSTTLSLSGAGSEEEEISDVPYHYAGIRFGNGIYLDYNQNLSVDLVEFYNLDAGDFTVVQKLNSADLFAPAIEYKLMGSEFIRAEKAILGHKTTVSLSGSPIVVEEGLFKTRIELFLHDDKLICKPDGVFGFLGKAEIEKTEEGLAIPGLWKDSEFTWDGPDKIVVDKDFSITKEGNELLIEYKGIFGITKTYRFIRTAAGFIFFDNDYHGVMAEKKGDNITVTRDRTTVFTAEIE